MYRFSKFEKPVFDYYSLYPKKCGLSKKLKVFLLDIRIKQSGLKIIHSKVPSSGYDCKENRTRKLEFEALSFVIRQFHYPQCVNFSNKSISVSILCLSV